MANFSEKCISSVITKKKVALKSENNGNIGFISTDIRVPVIVEFNNTYKINFGGRVGYIAKGDTTEDTGTTVLMYHGEAENKKETAHANNRMVIDFEQFKEEVKYLKNNNWHTISLPELQEWLFETKPYRQNQLSSHSMTDLLQQSNTFIRC